MQFRLEQRIKAPRSKVEAAFTDVRFAMVAGKASNLAVREVLGRREVGDAVVIEVRFAYTGDISPMVRTFVDPEQLTWVTTSTVHSGEHWAEFVVAPDHHADWLQASGRYTFDELDGEAGSGPQTSETMEGEVVVNVPVFGRAAERGLVNGFAQHLEEQASLLEGWEPAGE